MTDEPTNDNETEVTTYFCSFQPTIGVYLDSPYDLEESRRVFEESLHTAHGDSPPPIVEFREATADEIEAFLGFGAVGEPEPTIN